MTMTGNCALNGNAKAWREQGTDGCGDKSWILGTGRFDLSIFVEAKVFRLEMCAMSFFFRICLVQDGYRYWYQLQVTTNNSCDTCCSGCLKQKV